MWVFLKFKDKMTSKTQRPTFEKYQYAGLASRLIGSEESARYVPGALEVLAGKGGLNLGEEALGFIRGTQASEKGIETAINVYHAKFEEERGKYNPGDLIQWYDSVLGDLNTEEKETIGRTLGEYKETIGEIKKKVEEFMYKLKAPEGIKDKFTPEELSEAKEALKKYEKVLTVMEILDTYKFEELRPAAVNATRKIELKGLASKL